MKAQAASTDVRQDVFSDLLDRDEAAALLGVSPRTLDRWNLEGSGPVRIQVGRKVRYRRAALVDWLGTREGFRQPSA